LAGSSVLAGPNGNRVSLIIILAVGVAVTSVPVVSKIFADLKILHTTLVVAAIITSQFAGAWLDYVLRKGWPLLTTKATTAGENSETEKGLQTA
jgi:Kef-type K+ transport system membrane component KefB